MEPIQSFAQLTAHLKKLNHRKRKVWDVSKFQVLIRNVLTMQCA